MKKSIQFILIILVACLMCGCTSSIEKKNTIEYNEVELSNVENDKNLIESAKSLYESNDKKATNNMEKTVASIKYLDDVYAIASNRVNLDLEILGAFSEDYVGYIATCQAFSEVYLKERDKLVDTDLLSVDAIKQTDTGKMVDVLSETIDNFRKK